MHMATAATMLPEEARHVQSPGAGLPYNTNSDGTSDLLSEPSNGVEQYSGQGEDDAPRSPVRKAHKKSSSVRINGHGRDKEDSSPQLMVEKFQDKDGEHLTTIRQYRPPGRSETEVRRSDELVSGRRVGTKWERSQCVTVNPNLPHQR